MPQSFLRASLFIPNANLGRSPGHFKALTISTLVVVTVDMSHDRPIAGGATFCSQSREKCIQHGEGGCKAQGRAGRGVPPLRPALQRLSLALH